MRDRGARPSVVALPLRGLGACHVPFAPLRPCRLRGCRLGAPRLRRAGSGVPCPGVPARAVPCPACRLGAWRVRACDSGVVPGDEPARRSFGPAGSRSRPGVRRSPARAMTGNGPRRRRRRRRRMVRAAAPSPSARPAATARCGPPVSSAACPRVGLWRHPLTARERPRRNHGTQSVASGGRTAAPVAGIRLAARGRDAQRSRTGSRRPHVDLGHPRLLHTCATEAIGLDGDTARCTEAFR